MRAYDPPWQGKHGIRCIWHLQRANADVLVIKFLVYSSLAVQSFSLEFPGRTLLSKAYRSSGLAAVLSSLPPQSLHLFFSRPFQQQQGKKIKSPANFYLCASAHWALARPPTTICPLGSGHTSFEGPRTNHSGKLYPLPSLCCTISHCCFQHLSCGV